MYKKVDTGLNFVGREQEVLDFWKENSILKRVFQKMQAALILPSMTARLRLTVSLI